MKDQTKTCLKCGHLYVPKLGICPDCKREVLARNGVIELTEQMARRATAAEIGLQLVRNNILGKGRQSKSAIEGQGSNISGMGRGRPSSYAMRVATRLQSAISGKIADRHD